MAGEIHFTLGKGMECLKSIIGHNNIVSFLHFNDLFFSFLAFFSGFVVKTRIALPFQQGVHPLPNYLKRSFLFNISCAKSVKPLFYLRICFEDFIKTTIYFTHDQNSLVSFLWSYRIWAYLRDKHFDSFLGR